VVVHSGGRLELIEGSYYPKMHPPVSHIRAAASLAQNYLPLHQETSLWEGWWIVPEPDVLLGGSRVIPSLAGWRQKVVSEPPHGSRWRVRPDWVCEISAASTRDSVHELKRDLYQRHQIPFLWEVDIGARCLKVWRLPDGRAAYQLAGEVHADDEAAHLAPFSELTLRPGTLWK
jgi:Uma2 family endonuclease